MHCCLPDLQVSFIKCLECHASSPLSTHPKAAKIPDGLDKSWVRDKKQCCEYLRVIVIFISGADHQAQNLNRGGSTSEPPSISMPVHSSRQVAEGQHRGKMYAVGWHASMEKDISLSYYTVSRGDAYQYVYRDSAITMIIHAYHRAQKTLEALHGVSALYRELFNGLLPLAYEELRDYVYT